ncbi:hypothetical protein BDB01DRAFT_433977 [Pilobolus umbonatus]|nr:hypothetical protein BDB01DRAFT_433977 [Pilobolus umbonatus]
MVTNWRKPFRRQMNGQSRDINPDVATETEQRPEDDMVGPLSPVNLLKTSLFHKSSNRHERKPSRSQLYSDRLKIFIGTWNMYGRLLPLDLSYFLTKDEKKSNSQSLSLDGNTSHPYHLLVIGTQECERDISESLINSSKTEWEKKLSNHLGSQYKLIKTETLTAIHIAVFVWVPVAHMIKDVQSDSVKTGWANVIGNKGAVAVSVLFGNRSLLFITCHLRGKKKYI